MAKVIMIFFLTLSSVVGYYTYTGIGQDTIKTISKEESIRSNSYHSFSTGGHFGSYNSSGFSYGK